MGYVAISLDTYILLGSLFQHVRPPIGPEYDSPDTAHLVMQLTSLTHLANTLVILLMSRRNSSRGLRKSGTFSLQHITIFFVLDHDISRHLCSPLTTLDESLWSYAPLCPCFTSAHQRHYASPFILIVCLVRFLIALLRKYSFLRIYFLSRSLTPLFSRVSVVELLSVTSHVDYSYLRVVVVFG